MKRILLLVMLLASISLLIGARPMQHKDRPILPESLAEIAGEAVWYHEWPHGRLPLEPDGYDLVRGPFNFVAGNHGMTMDNWGMETTYRSRKDDIQFSVWVLEDETRGVGPKSADGPKSPGLLADGPISGIPIKATQGEATSRAIEFHDLRAGIAVWTSKDAPETQTDRYGRLQGPRHVILVFRIQETLFLISSRDRNPIEMIERNLLSFAELVYQRNIDRTKDQPHQ